VKRCRVCRSECPPCTFISGLLKHVVRFKVGSVLIWEYIGWYELCWREWWWGMCYLGYGGGDFMGEKVQELAFC